MLRRVSFYEKIYVVAPCFGVVAVSGIKLIAAVRRSDRMENSFRPTEHRKRPVAERRPRHFARPARLSLVWHV